MKNYFVLLSERLEDNYALNEAWSDTMPDWIKSRVQFLANNTSDWNVRTDSGSRIRYAKKRGDRWAPDMDLFQSLKASVDLQNATFVTPGDFPSSGRHPYCKSPNIPIWHLRNGQIYACGINDDEKLDRWDFYPDTDASGKAFKYISVKELNKLSDDFCYIDGASLGDDFKDKMQLRAENNWYKEYERKRSDPLYVNGTDNRPYLSRRGAGKLFAHRDTVAQDSFKKLQQFKDSKKDIIQYMSIPVRKEYDAIVNGFERAYQTYLKDGSSSINTGDLKNLCKRADNFDDLDMGSISNLVDFE